MTEHYAIGPRPGDDYAERIKRLRGEIGLTQQVLADRLGVSFATVNRWENGHMIPSRLATRAIAALIGTDPPERGVRR